MTVSFFHLPDFSKVRFSQARQEEGSTAAWIWRPSRWTPQAESHLLLAYSRSIGKGLLASAALSVSVRQEWSVLAPRVLWLVFCSPSFFNFTMF